VAFGSGEWPRSYEAQVREGCALNPVAQRAVRLVAESVGAAPVVCSEPEVARLVAATSGGQGLVETLASHLLLHGNAYVQVLVSPGQRPSILRQGSGQASLGTSEVVELYALRPDRVTVEADARGWPGAYLYRVGEVLQRIDASELIHIRSFHPTDDHYGLGCLGAAAGAVAIHNAATRWNKALLDNAARPSGALVYEPGDGSGLSAEQFGRLRGRRGTAPAVHAIGARFVLIEAEALLAYDPPQSAAGGEVRMLASGIGDADPAEALVPSAGEALRPPPPVHFGARVRAGGGFDLHWIRSSRVGWSWIDGTDAPLGESEERYQLRIERSDGSVEQHELASPFFHYEAADAAADLLFGSVAVTVRQAGAGALSRPAALTINP
jgi:hypothetical protein